MSTEARTIHLEAAAFAALQEAAARRHKSLDEMATEIVMEGLRVDQLGRVQALLAKGHRHGAASGIPKGKVVDVIHADRKQRRGTR